MKISRLHIDITGDCNLSCIYCYLSQRGPFGKKLTTEEIISIIGGAADYGISRFSISGGEPLHNPDFFTILEETKKKGKITLFTNLYTADKKTLEKIISHGEIQEIITSLDGFSGHDIARPPSKANKIIEKLTLLREMMPILKLTVNTVIHKFNLDELIDLFKLLNRIGVSLWRLDLPLRSSRKDIFCSLEQAVLKSAEIVKLRYAKIEYQKSEISIFKVYKSQLEKIGINDVASLTEVNAHPCQYFLGTISIKENGRISLCPSFNLTMGSIGLNSNFAETAQKISEHQFFSMNLASIAPCKNCRYFQLCGTGCRSDALDWTKNYENADPISCSIMPLTEKYVLPILSKNLRVLYQQLIDEKGSSPKYNFQSQSEIC
ncbi:radical SAM protein [Patescibacteria group bacterium]|nr:radical SAM protein [Patescibacteria group bacterium]